MTYSYIHDNLQSGKSQGGSLDTEGTLIRSAAHFVVCTCKLHGHVVYADGSESGSICSVDAGMLEVKGTLKAGQLLPIERSELERQIKNSGLKQELSLVDIVVSETEVLGLLEETAVNAPPQQPPTCNN